jgi:hypothetical protein
MGKKLLVLDFDGTMTDAEAEGAPYRQGYLEDIALLAGLETQEVLEMADRLDEQVRSDISQFGWNFGGRIVAPASVDPYLRIMPVARMILDQANAFMNLEERSRLLDGILYKYNYTKTRIVFRTGARQVLEALAGTETYVVTNSHTVPVQNKIKHLGTNADGTNSLGWLVDRVTGRAQKYVIDDSFTDIAEAMTLPGLDRPVFLRRRLYHDVLWDLLSGAGLGWQDLVVCGDIFELDLALPMAMGATVALMANDYTPLHEINYLNEHPRGQVLHSLEAVPGLLGR